ncbi:MAG: hydrogenase maturation nickel metallochaperone HypA, partial [Microcystaceae cyanobacterium]
MHELGITQSLVETAIASAQGAKIEKVTLEIGQLTAIAAEAIAFCFETCAIGTLLEGSVLEIIEKPGQGRCRQCGREFFLEIPFGICECGSTDLEIIQGLELQLKSLEI